MNTTTFHRVGASLGFYQALRFLFALIVAVRIGIILYGAFVQNQHPFPRLWDALLSLALVTVGFSIGWWSLTVNIYHAKHRRVDDAG